MSDSPDESGPASGAKGTNVAVTAAAAVGGLGCLASPVALVGGIVVVIIVGGLGVLLAPVIALILLFTGGGDKSPDINPDQVVSAVQGDGKGELDPTTVPADLVDPIQRAGALCPEVGPIAIAAQIQQESGFSTTVVGDEGEVGLSQLPPEVFVRFGKDDDGNGGASALDPTDSILTQGRYMCSLVEQLTPLADAGRPLGDVLSLALAAYDTDVDTVRVAGSVPQTNESQNYVLQVRANFARFQGVVPAPSPSPVTTPTPSPEGQ
ncbi:transglycosylase SLT domain-containing protein [Streptomyces sp. AK02-01A]|uniref:transglycosylase SLT domain-containing protein n=1 Tax=Streptomyces sp. AK02-01A TaxID=3028648 RepID=UPI0029B917C8|nr:transglycosylase SLT domain-containing protein [Streptomyces sp. AK02-01A]MDX3850996.1 transglycosylase SLT domain-containing protein [Streptomyces sp. AK02-01A]